MQQNRTSRGGDHALRACPISVGADDFIDGCLDHFAIGSIN
jgi:hypothetical protein